MTIVAPLSQARVRPDSRASGRLIVVPVSRLRGASISSSADTARSCARKPFMELGEHHPTPTPPAMRPATARRARKGHDLRRPAASLMTSSGTPRLVVSKVVNHSEPGVTVVYDRHRNDDENKVCARPWARTLAAVLTGKKGSNV